MDEKEDLLIQIERGGANFLTLIGELGFLILIMVGKEGIQVLMNIR